MRDREKIHSVVYVATLSIAMNAQESRHPQPRLINYLSAVHRVIEITLELGYSRVDVTNFYMG